MMSDDDPIIKADCEKIMSSESFPKIFLFLVSEPILMRIFVTKRSALTYYLARNDDMQISIYKRRWAASFLMLLIALPAAARQSTLPVPAHLVTEKGNRTMLRGIDTVVLVVKQSEKTDQDTPVVADKDLVVDVGALRKSIAQQLNTAGIKTVTESEQTTKASSLPRLEFQLVTGKALSADPAVQSIKYWTMAVNLTDAVIPYRQIQSGKTIHAYNVVVWQADIRAVLVGNGSIDQSIGDKYRKPVGNFLRDWRIANNKQLFDAFPKH